MEKEFNFGELEPKIYNEWIEKGNFKPQSDFNKNFAGKKFSIVLPPPNITSQLHVGHALNITLQDVIVRYKRMCGYDTLWIPGTDHASIATEVKVVEKLKKEGKSKQDLGREGFLKEVWAWAEKYKNKISEQVKVLGSSCDWDRVAFTMDDSKKQAVNALFKKLYEDNKIYRGTKVINWCPDCKTTLSDAEVEHNEQESFLWHIKYPFTEGNGFVVVATTRPETLFGDVAVAVNPQDARYSSLIGKMLNLPLTNRQIPIIADNMVDTTFGTGCVKITPAHDFNDYETGKRHNLEQIEIINKDGTMKAICGEFAGLDRLECREKAVEKLKALGLIDKIVAHTVNRGHCYRCHNAVEPMLSTQWFVKMDELVKPAIKAVEDGTLKIYPKNVEKVYLHWLTNIQEWCISRQLWWGHRIPAYTCQDCGNIMIDEGMPTYCNKCGKVHLIQDEDVLDTWFSSALWPISTLGWPQITNDMNKFYPTDLIVTGYDIIFFWIARMVMVCNYVTGKLPFNNVIFNGLVRDSQGRKMSKSLGNGIDPIQMIDKYGADALRFSLIFGSSTGSDSRFSEEKITNDRKFIHKIWNAGKFVKMCVEQAQDVEIQPEKLTIFDKWLEVKFNSAIKNIRKQMDNNEVFLPLQFMYEYVWNDFCDNYLELIKPFVYSQDLDIKNHSTAVLRKYFCELLAMLSPVIPFVTEEIYKEFNTKSLMLQEYPQHKNINSSYIDNYKETEKVINLIATIRQFRTDMQVEVSKKIDLLVIKPSIKLAQDNKLLEFTTPVLQKLCNINNVIFMESIPNNTISMLSEMGEFIFYKEQIVDAVQEKIKLEKDLENANKEYNTINARLNNDGFRSKAPQKIIRDLQDRANVLLSIIKNANEKLNNL